MSSHPARLENPGPSSSRTPLGPRAVSPTPAMQKQIRRKSSFMLRGDSSEDYPSPHDSIFEAYHFSTATSEESRHTVDSVSISQHSTLGATNETNENIQVIAPANTYSVDDVEFRYGHGTVLETITEQKSSNTMRSLVGTNSVDAIPRFPFLSHYDNFELAKSSRRANSFSVDDLALIKRNYHEACSMIERETCKPLPIHEIYAQPRNPIYPPVTRPPTPPGMPSWTASQSLPPRIRNSNNEPAVQNRLQRFLSIPSSGITHSSRVLASSSISRGRTVSTPAMGRVAPRFRPPRSAYGPIHQHPFVNAPVAKVLQIHPPAPLAEATSSAAQTGTRLPRPTDNRKLGKRVRFSPSATARDSEMVSLQAAILSTSASAVHPLALTQITPQATHSLPKHPQCPHRKSRREAFNNLRKSLNHDSISNPSCEYLSVLVNSPSRQASTLSHESSTPILMTTNLRSLTSWINTPFNTADSGIVDSEPSRTTSFSSTTHLMARTLRDPSPTPSFESCQISNTTLPTESKCWKCTVEKAFARIDQWWIQSTNCLCLVCCGLDIDDDLNLLHGSGETRSTHHGIAGGRF